MQEEADEAEKTLLSLLATGRLPKGMVTPDDFDSPVTQELGEALQAGKKPAQILSEAEDEGVRSLASEVFSRLGGTDIDLILPAAEECLRTLAEEDANGLRRDVRSSIGDEKRQALEDHATGQH